MSQWGKINSHSKFLEKKIHCSIKKSKSFKEDITCNKKLIKFDTAFSGSQPHQMNYKIQHFKDQLQLHHQGDVKAEVEWSLFTSPWQWRWSWSPKSWILQFIWCSCLPKNTALSSVTVKISKRITDTVNAQKTVLHCISTSYKMVQFWVTKFL